MKLNTIFKREFFQGVKMRKITLLLSMTALLYIGCSSGNPALHTLQMQSELAGNEASKAKIKKEFIEYANIPLDSSRSSEEIGDDQLALVQAELSNLRYRVVFAKAKREKEKKDSILVQEGLAKDKQRLEEYKAILKQEKVAKEAQK